MIRWKDRAAAALFLFSLAAAVLVGNVNQRHVYGETPSAASLDRGIVKSLAEVTITADLNAPIKRVAFRKGQKFKKGDILIEFDCRRYHEDLAGAEAEARAARANFRTQAEMARHRAAGRNEVEIARAKFEKARAAARALAVRVEQCTITAPFGGRVGDIAAHEFEIPQPNTPLMKIIDDAHVEIDLILSSKSLAWLKPGTKFQFVIDETKKSYRAAISRIGAAVDPVSQTIEVTAVFLEPPENVIPGMSGTAIFEDAAG